MSTEFTGFVIDGRKVPVTLKWEGKLLFIRSGFNKKLIEELKAMDGAKWHPDRKEWSINATDRNLFQVEYLEGKNPYAAYDQELIPLQSKRQLYGHQVVGLRHFITRKHCIYAAEMGTGKTLAAIEAMESTAASTGAINWIWVGPRSAINAVKLEFKKWNALINPEFVTYSSLKSFLMNLHYTPHGVVFDECSRIKNPTAQRSVAAFDLANIVRSKNGYIFLMSGSPAPRNPCDWWHLCEVACPGYLREGNIMKFKNRLAVIENRESISGGVYPHLVTWLNDERLCKHCGRVQEDPVHDLKNMVAGDTLFHRWEPSKNEVRYLGERMKGLVIVQFKKDCFGGETKYLTKSGLKRFIDTVGTKQFVLTYNSIGAEYIESEIKYFGKAPTYKITFGDRSEVTTTLNHNWMFQEKGIIPFLRRKTTQQLKIGKTELPLILQSLSNFSEEGYAHGFVYGDGWICHTPESTRIHLYGEHDKDMIPLLSKFGNRSDVSVFNPKMGCSHIVPVINSMPKHWKELPYEQSKEYITGFILGLICADGCINKSEIRLYQADLSQIEKIKELAIACGFRCYPVKLSRTISPIDGSYKPLYWFNISSYNLTKEMFLRKDYADKLIINHKNKCITVKKIEPTGQIEDVYCAVVPKTHNLVLENNVITGNCLDLPDKIYRIVKCEISASTKRVMDTIVKTAPRAITALTLLRELSDGFQYKEKETDNLITCPTCKGASVFEDVDVEKCKEMNIDYTNPTVQIPMKQTTCTRCKEGKIKAVERVTEYVKTPKEEALKDIIDEHEEVGRLVIYAGFTGSIDKIVSIVQAMNWKWIRIDGRGWHTNCTKPDGTLIKESEMLEAFQDGLDEYPQLAIIAHPESGGMGMTLTASPTIVFYSNDFKAENRIQAEDRIHRPGMDKQKGATIIDIVHLPTDDYVIENLKKKRELQALSMERLKEYLDSNPVRVKTDSPNSEEKSNGN